MILVPGHEEVEEDDHHQDQNRRSAPAPEPARPAIEPLSEVMHRGRPSIDALRAVKPDIGRHHALGADRATAPLTPHAGGPLSVAITRIKLRRRFHRVVV